MKIKAILESILVGVISAMLSYFALISPATIAAVAMRRKMPHAWFSGLIVWYATITVILVSIGVAEVAYRVVYKHVAESARRSARFRWLGSAQFPHSDKSVSQDLAAHKRHLAKRFS